MDIGLLGLSEEQAALWRVCRDFTDKVIIPFIKDNQGREWSAPPEERWPKELLIEADKLGLRTVGLPEEYGGMKLDALTMVLIIEEIARGDPGFAVTLSQNWKIPALFGGIAPKHLQDHWFQRYLGDPTFLWAHCLTEPRGASDRWLPHNVPEANMDTKATFVDDHWILNGRKQFVSNAYLASAYIIYANTDPEAPMRQGTSSFLVPRSTPGLQVVRENEKIGQNYMINAEIFLEDCRVPEDHLLVKDIALEKAGAYFSAGKVLNAARAIGIGRAAMENTSTYVQDHVQGGKPIIQHQAIALRLAEMATMLETMRVFVYNAARALDIGSSNATLLGFMAKLYASETTFEICRQAMEIHGGSGAMREMGIEKHLRDSTILLHTDGTSDIHRFKIIKKMFPDTAGTYA
jgi:alkylation response protein AidB-like acyl-CoA dehydrogenase